ncbi:hypothetical protein [Nocardiopsis coralliicola]
MGRHAADNGGDESSVENTMAAPDDGSVEGDVTQVGGEDESRGERPQGQVRNTIVSGTVTGQVIQAGNVSGPLYFG